MTDFRYTGTIYNILTNEKFTFMDNNANKLLETLNCFCNTQYIPNLNKNVINIIQILIIDDYITDYETIYNARKRLSWYINDEIAWKGYTRIKVDYINSK